MIDASKVRVLAIDSSKFETRARIRSLPLPLLDIMVTDLDPADRRLDPYREQVARIL